MMLTLTLGFWLLALLPIALLLFVILGLGWGVSKAAPLGMLAALLVALLAYRSTVPALLLEALKGCWNAMTILLVIWTAVGLYELTCAADAFNAIRAGIAALTKHKLMQILILGWVFPSFLQGITGFGVAVAVGAPLLLSIGVSPFYSIVFVLLGHSWGATFGTLALAWDALVQQAGLSGSLLSSAAVLAAAMIWIFNFLAVLYVLWLYGRGRALREGFLPVLVISLIMGGGELLLAPVNAQISCFLSSALGLLAAFLLGRVPRYRESWEIKDSAVMAERSTAVEAQDVKLSFHEAFLPYYMLTIMTVLALLAPPINCILSLWKISFAFPETSTGLSYVTAAESCFSPLKPLTYAGTFLALSAVLSGTYYLKKGCLDANGIRESLQKTVKKCSAPTIAITCFIVMSKFMSSSGQIYILSRGIVQALGRYYVIAAPFLGVLSTFITSSNMSANILLGNFQMTAAQLLDISPAVTCALQTTGGVMGTAFSPGCLIMGISTTGYKGKESELLGRIIPLPLIMSLVFGIFVYFVLI